MAGGSRYLAVALALASATALAGCQKTTSSLDSAALSTASTGPASYETTAALGAKWEKNTADISTGIAYATALESIGQTQKQLEVYRRLSASNPSSAKVAGLYGKKLLTAGMSQEAIPVLEVAAADPVSDWRIRSALGTAYDQQGLYARARSEYQTILAADPTNLAVINNMGMSYALEGNLKQSEVALRKADALPRSKSEPRIRQNLALVVGLQGRFDEASNLASQDLPPEQVTANMAYLKKMLSQPNTWQQLSDNSEG